MEKWEIGVLALAFGIGLFLDKLEKTKVVQFLLRGKKNTQPIYDHLKVLGGPSLKPFQPPDKENLKKQRPPPLPTRPAFEISVNDDKILMFGDLNISSEALIAEVLSTLKLETEYKIDASNMTLDPNAVSVWISAANSFLWNHQLSYMPSQLAMILENDERYTHPNSYFVDPYEIPRIKLNQDWVVYPLLVGDVCLVNLVREENGFSINSRFDTATLEFLDDADLIPKFEYNDLLRLAVALELSEDSAT